MILLLSTFVVAVVSALCPFVNLEVFIAGIGALGKDYGVWSVSIAAAAGQTLGKLVWYQVGASSMSWPPIARKMQSPAWSRCFTKVRAQFERRPWAGMAMVFMAATVGLPPLAIVAVLCGQLRYRRGMFVALVFVGRALRFATVLGGSAWLGGTVS